MQTRKLLKVRRLHNVHILAIRLSRKAQVKSE